MSEFVSKATRAGYGEAIAELGAENENIVVLDADLAGSTQSGKIRTTRPDHFFNCGIAEANMIGIAAGLSLSGFTVFASSFAMFASERAFEQVRNSIGYPHLNVKIAASHGGISVGEDGASHQCCEDIALMRTIPGMTIINPADWVEAKAAVKAAAAYEGPVYLRFGRLAVPQFYDADTFEFVWGKATTLRAGTDVAILATGLMVPEAMTAAETLEEQGISARVVNITTIKPLDEETVLQAAGECGCVVTAEEHSIIGGLGGAVSELLSEKLPTPVLRVGVKDVFGRSGPAKELLHLYGLDAEAIAAAAREAVAFKKRLGR